MAALPARPVRVPGTLPTGSATYKDTRLDLVGYLVRGGEVPTGFVLVRGTTGDLRVLGEFFVVRRLPRSGVGPSVALEVCCEPVPDKPHIPPDVWISLETPFS